ncbi:related to vacuolar membrane PQ loop repeat protein [Ramularia collo-cygni]|uniref:Related to vacuolar membrane PQ loop repeat protein n=1 Tax=Ramularia collo-cygni TaxID=112498 RepID=A0A2D3VMS7_9PEZI|nr:related to vacuolar membrane PQ loop repeat protein [Ramularia collo-cygni]CZT22948.1 related to vacuolar membrane PQ loop repeat protein [Ramularia collo-cygni]
MHPIALTWNEALSGIGGSISLAAWLFLLVPQLYENYQQGHADGISLTFLFIWAIGDVTNLAGALWAGLVPTVIALAIYFCILDTILIAQCLYYRSVKNGKLSPSAQTEPSSAVAPNERAPLLSNEAPKSPTQDRHRRLTDVTDENMGLPGSRRRSSALHRTSTNDLSSHVPVVAQPTPRAGALRNTVSIIMIMIAGAAGWAVAWKSGAWRPTAVSGEGGSGEATPIGAEVLGYASAVCYLGARIPQIIKNQKERSCDGLSLLFFLLSLLGNASYGAGILFHSLEKSYILTNLPWLIGSLGTMVEDAIIFVQFHAFGEKVPEGEPAVV